MAVLRPCASSRELAVRATRSRGSGTGAHAGNGEWDHLRLEATLLQALVFPFFEVPNEDSCGGHPIPRAIQWNLASDEKRHGVP